MKIKTSLIIFLICCLLISGCQVISRFDPSSSENSNSANQALDKNPFALYKPNLVANQQNKLDEFSEATRYLINLEIEDSLTSMNGHQDVLYTNEETAALDKLYFDLIPNSGGDYLKVNNIQVNNSPVRGVLAFENSALEIDLAEPLPPGESINISMDF